MENNQQSKADWETLQNAWMGQVGGFWTSMAEMWSKSLSAMGNFSPDNAREGNGSQQSQWSTSESAQELYSALLDLALGKGALKGATGPLPELLLKLARTSWNGYLEMQGQLFEKGNGDSSEAFNMETISQKMRSAWMENIQETLRPILNIPPVGLTRIYQERMNQTVEKFNAFSVALGELMHQLNTPLEQSSRIIREKLDQMTKEGNASDKRVDPYNMWIKVLESHYMELFQTPEYMRALHDALNSYNDFVASQQQVSGDWLKALPFPTNKDLDELSKEIYLSKKKLRELTKRMEALEGTS
jgi:hypothetical protein